MKDAYTAIANRSYGVELEFTGVTRMQAAEVLAQCVGFERELIIDASPYNRHKVFDRLGRPWFIMRDGSVNGGSAKSCELVTPILRGPQDLALLETIADALVVAGGVTDSSCGMHVHIGCEDYTPQKLRVLQNTWAAHEDLLYMGCLVDEDHRDVHYCKKTSQIFLEQLNKKKPVEWEQFWDIFYEEDSECVRRGHYNCRRYHGLNLHSVYNHKNVEFRLFNGTLDSTAINAATLFCLCLVEDTYQRKGGCTAKKVSLDNPAFFMRTWTNRLGLIGPEFANARRWLYEKLPGNAAWRNGEPTKRRKVSKLERS